MGFISSAQTNGMTIYLTPKAVEYISGRKKSASDLSITYFSLGDSDADYTIINRLTAGFVPDISGENVSCLNNISLDLNNAELFNNWLNSTDINKGAYPPSFHKWPITL